MGSPAERAVEDALAHAVLSPRPYTEREVEAAEARIAARLANRMLYSALCLDDEIRDGFGGGMRSAARLGGLGKPGGPGGAAATARTGEAARHLGMLCRTVVEREGALQHMAAFLGRRIPQPAGARVLGCVLQLAGREDGARFWWQFAAGAGDAAAAYCLYLHHLTLGEAWEAELWRRQADRGDGPKADAGESGVGADAGVGEEDGSSPGLVLRVLTRLRGSGGEVLTARASAVVHYVPDAVRFVDEIELPLPDADFAERIEELTRAGGMAGGIR
ncbi:hypothetical protein [Streptomyces sp. 6N223]|uniref:hypothetical protein n=1 Tax=Streptomyces sp. 6N223 TaxID=3457412 RepID=UPI003FD516E0